jgi:hypothetical protein
MRGSTPWRGGREKDPLLFQLFMESTTPGLSRVWMSTSVFAGHPDASDDPTDVRLGASYSSHLQFRYPFQGKNMAFKL